MNDGLYIELFHGRADPSQVMDDWGEPGPVFGPFRFVHTTYASDIKLGRYTDSPQDLVILRDMVYYHGMWYGDWSVFPASTFQAEKELQARCQEFDLEKAKIPGELKQIVGQRPEANPKEARYE